jgi:hypothetical protein
VRTLRPATLEDRLLVTTMAPLVTERRGLVGLDGPSGAWMRVVSPVAYRWRTLDKFCAELKYAGVGDALWERHLAQWAAHNERWTQGQGFRQLVAYLDGSQDPWWTHEFARSGKVARVGRVMPCLSRLLLSGGAGTPLLVETFSGQASIRKQLPSLLTRVDDVLGKGKLARLLVVDAELVSVELFIRSWTRNDPIEPDACSTPVATSCGHGPCTSPCASTRTSRGCGARRSWTTSER